MSKMSWLCLGCGYVKTNFKLSVNIKEILSQNVKELDKEALLKHFCYFFLLKFDLIGIFFLYQMEGYP